MKTTKNRKNGKRITVDAEVVAPSIAAKSESKDVAVVKQSTAVVNPTDFNREKIELLKSTICKGATDLELEMFIEICKRTRLDPFRKQIYAVKRWDSREGKEVMSPQTGIDGFRSQAERSGQYQGSTEPEWCGTDGVWRKVWFTKKDGHPELARVGVWRKGFREPVYRIAAWDSFCATIKNKKTGIWEAGPFWKRMGEHMLAKCAEAQALRAAFPQELSGLTIPEETEAMDASIREVTEPHAYIEPPTMSDERKREIEAQKKEAVDAVNPNATPAQKAAAIDYTVSVKTGKPWATYSDDTLIAAHAGLKSAGHVEAIASVLRSRGYEIVKGAWVKGAGKATAIGNSATPFDDDPHANIKDGDEWPKEGK